MAKQPKFYAVAAGFGGPNTYSTWPDAEKAVKGFPGALHKSFPTRESAQEWLLQQRNRPARVPSSWTPSKKPPVSVDSGFDAMEDVKQDVKPRSSARYAPYPTSRSSTTSTSSQKSWTGMAAKAEPHVDFDLSGSPEDRKPLMNLSQQSYSHAFNSPPRFKLSQASQRLSQAAPSLSSSQGACRDDPLLIMSSPEAPQQAMFAKQPMSLLGGIYPKLEQNDTSSDSDLPEVGSSKPRAKPVRRLQNPNNTRFKQEYATDNASAAFGQAMSGPSTMPAGAATNPAAPVAIEPQLSAEQQAVLERVKRGESIFFTGSAGVGKSVLTRAIIRELRNKYPKQSAHAVAVTATTGIAATNIEGTTLHSWAGVGLGKLEAEKHAFGVMKNRNNATRWRECRALIVDEISMLDGKFFDKLEEIARTVRSNSSPFGGIQLVLTGDFYQLPPVPDYAGHGQQKVPVKFAFDARSWSTCIKHIAVLKQVFRQKDQTFVDILNEMRRGKLSTMAIREFSRLQRPIKYADGLEPTCLYPKRDEVARQNNQRLAALQGEGMTFHAEDSSGRDEKGQAYYNDREKLQNVLNKNTMVEATQMLKVGSQVMLVKNLADRSLVNGSIGKIIALASADEVQSAWAGEPDEDELIEQAMQYEQDCEDDIDRAIADAEGVEYKPSIRRATAANKIKVDLSGVAIAEAQLTERERAAMKLEPGEKPDRDVPMGRFPVVEFRNGKKMLCAPLEFTVQNSVGRDEAKRKQVPLILAWALSIHKSQGQTLERVRVDMANIFEAGQAYVALSRATRLDSLQVLHFNANKVFVHPRVLEWHSEL